MTMRQGIENDVFSALTLPFQAAELELLSTKYALFGRLTSNEHSQHVSILGRSYSGHFDKLGQLQMATKKEIRPLVGYRGISSYSPT